MEHFGIEALSRGAKKAYFCDKSVDAAKVIKRNLEKTNLIGNAIILCEDYQKLLKMLNEKIDIIFIDPPYKDDLAVNAVHLIVENEIINIDGIIVIETDEIQRDTKELEKIDKLKIVDQRKYGRASLIFIKLEKNITDGNR